MAHCVQSFRGDGTGNSEGIAGGRSQQLARDRTEDSLHGFYTEVSGVNRLPAGIGRAQPTLRGDSFLDVPTRCGGRGDVWSVRGREELGGGER